MKKALLLVLVINLALCAKADAFIVNSYTFKTYNVVQKYPEFAGGALKFRGFIALDQIWPDYVRHQIGGHIALTFILEKDGSLADIKIVRGIRSGCDEQAIRLIKECPKWNPGNLKWQKTQRSIYNAYKFSH
jgi:hypothetical protein